MQLTREADYAVRVVLDLAEHRSDGPIRSADVARRQMVPAAFLRKVVQALAGSGYITTTRGARGGITLAREPAGITLRDVIEAIEGTLLLNRCVAYAGACPRDRRCPVHPVWHRIQQHVRRELDGVTFADLRTAWPTIGPSHNSEATG